MTNPTYQFIGSMDKNRVERLTEYINNHPIGKKLQLSSDHIRSFIEYHKHQPSGSGFGSIIDTESGRFITKQQDAQIKYNHLLRMGFVPIVEQDNTNETISWLDYSNFIDDMIRYYKSFCTK